MNAYTLLKRYLHQYNCESQRECREEHGFYIRKDGELWRLYVDNESDVQPRFDDLAVFAYRYRFIVETPNNQWDVQQRGDWQYQLINIESEENGELR